MRTLAFRSAHRAGKRFLVLVHTSAEPNMDEWEAYLRQVKASLSVNTELVHSFVATDGGGPIAAQRRGLADVIHSCPGDLLTHVFTRDPFVRGIVTAFRWISRSPALAHTPEELVKVCSEYQVPVPAVLEAFAEVQRSFAPVLTLEQMRRSVEKPKRQSVRQR